MSRHSLSPDHQLPRAPIGVEHPKLVARIGLTLVQHEPQVQGLEVLGGRELGGAVTAANLLVWDVGHVDGPDGAEVSRFEVADGLEILHGDGLVVLSAAGEDLAVGGFGGGEGGVGPLGGLGGDGVEVGVEEEGGEGGVGPGPGEEEEGLAGGELEGPGAEAEGVSLREEVGDGGGVVGVGVGGVDSEKVEEEEREEERESPVRVRHGSRRYLSGGGRDGEASLLRNELSSVKVVLVVTNYNGQLCPMPAKMIHPGGYDDKCPSGQIVISSDWKCLAKHPVSRTYGPTPRKNYSLKNLLITWRQLAGSSQQVAFWSYGPRFGGVQALASTLYTKKERMRKIYRGWRVLQTRTGLGYDPATDTVVCSDETWHNFIKDNKECTHLRYEGLRNQELYYNIFEKNHAAGASGFGSVMMGGGSTPSFNFDFSMDQSETQPGLEEEISSSIGARRQANTRVVNDEGGPSWSRGSAGKRKQRDATDEMTFEAMQEIANHFRDQTSQKDHILDCMNIMKEMGIPQYQRTIMWHYFDAHPRLQRPFCLLDDGDRKGIIASVVSTQMPPPN
ncbi:hypothetical protein TIFTF001_020894 [Ficus carica]|uniref:Myb/SANT-like domain-containing protein n=1 Tax=Ficus carica TaxID=3494 RepID=A0AA88AUH6_FICCA|nr:hypothetical protein TIFTF001_020894 [Ficus carica]